eukprot:TRINITY_DN17801_c0_g1_i1.p1 TRINITY_DN17801_c0_g1~~TRINITY_DN17801_c0_g1_i1.p1  ORF type:complete len:270 (-),score=37.47 TRINITY_DN17801_c0_g1_i1:350-1093(-)
MVILLAAIFVFVYGVAYADFLGDGSDFDIEVQAEIVGADVTVTKNANPLNFGQLLPTGTGGGHAYVAIDLGTFSGGLAVSTSTANPAEALGRATNAVVKDANTIGDTGTAFQAGNAVAGVLLDGTTRTPGGFTMATTYPTSVEVTIQDQITLTGDVDDGFGTFPTMTLSDIRACSNVVGDGTAVAVSSTVFVWIGGILDVAEDQPAGNYANAAGGINVQLAFEQKFYIILYNNFYWSILAMWTGCFF